MVNKLVDFPARVKFFRMIVNPLSVSQRSLKLALSSDGRPQQRRRHLMLAGISSNSTHYLRERHDQRSLDENIYYIFVYFNRRQVRRPIALNLQFPNTTLINCIFRKKAAVEDILHCDFHRSYFSIGNSKRWGELD